MESARAVQAKIFQVYGRIEFSGAGENTFTSPFPVWFVEVPQLNFGGELKEGTVLVPGSYPTVNCLIGSWSTRVRHRKTYYVGATFVVVITGPATTEGLVHWQLEGVGLMNPLV